MTPIDRFVEVLHLDRGLVVPRREQRGLVDQVREIRAGEPGRPGRQDFQVDVRR